MSSRARLVPRGRAVPYDWGGAGLSPAEPEPSPYESVEQAAPVNPGAQQAVLAELERDAFTKGYTQGERAGGEAGQKRAEATLRRLGQTIEELGTLRRTMIAQTERQMVQLALALAKRIVRREVTLDEDLVVAMARVALDRLGETATANLRLNPDDYAAIVAQHGESWAGTHVSVTPDAAVRRGGCLVQSDFGFIDSSIDAQLEQLSHALLGDGHELPVVERHE